MFYVFYEVIEILHVCKAFGPYAQLILTLNLISEADIAPAQDPIMIAPQIFKSMSAAVPITTPPKN